MMQQIASTKTQSAAPALPFTLRPSAVSVQSETRQSFNTELLRESRAVNVYEQPRQPHQPDTAKNSSREVQNAGDQVRSKQRSDERKAVLRHDSLLKKQDRIDKQVNSRLDEQRSRQQDALADAKYNESSKSTATVGDSSGGDIGKSSQRNADNAKSSREQTKRSSTYEMSQAENERVHNAESTSRSETINSNSTSNEGLESVLSDKIADHGADLISSVDGTPATQQFDYLDYVTQIAEFTGSPVEPNTIEHAPVDSNLRFLPADNKGSLADAQALNEKAEAESLVELSVEATNAETKVSILSDIIDETLSKETLGGNVSAIVGDGLNDVAANAKEINKAESSEHLAYADLTPKEELALKRTVEELVSQLEATGVSANALTQADKDLLTDLLRTESAKTEIKSSDVLAALELSGQTSKLNGDSIIKPESGKITPVGIGEKLPKTDLPIELVEGDNSSAKILNAGSQQDTVLGNNSHVLKEDKIQRPAGDSVRQIALLNEEQSKIALESLSARVQAATGEARSDNKGNEFIAALQSGVKEFKQQLAQGREPGIDLKALVSEALAQISGENAAQQPKIDAAVNQFSQVLNLANAASQSASLQQSMLPSNPDLQMTKEINLAHIEGTKLANTTQSQLNMHASAEKAINIFKQEGQQQLAEKVRWMVNAKSTTAEIRLDPPDLGGINIKINLSGDTAQVNFNVQSAAAKEALDQGAPRLREMLQEQGIELGESHVQQDNQGGGQENEPDHSNNSMSSSNSGATGSDTRHEESGEPVIEQRVSAGVLGGIDYYA